MEPPTPADALRAELRTLCPALGTHAVDVLAHMYGSTHLQGTDGAAEVTTIEAASNVPAG